MRVDSHQHFWRLDRGDYRWLTPDLVPLYRDYLPEDLEPLLTAASIDRTVLVQAADSVDESRYLLSLAAEHDFVGAVVGWVDFESPTAPEILAELASNEYFRGVRPMIQDIPDTSWMLGASLAPTFDALERLDLVFDALVGPVHLESLLDLLGARPGLRAVIDHAAKPTIGRGGGSDGGFEHWAAHMRNLADLPNTVCKLSGLITEADPGWRARTLCPYTDHLLESFGPERLLWGSDWPVVNLAGDYAQWVDTTSELLADLTTTERDAVLGTTAARTYGITE
jgi:L-fuconolactonase